MNMAGILASFKAIPQLFQMLLVGLAGNTPQVQSCAVRALIFNMKNTIKVDSMVRRRPTFDEENVTVEIEKLSSADPAMQDFLRKVTRIVALLLKDQTAPKELHKSVLKFLKIVITFLVFSD